MERREAPVMLPRYETTVEDSQKPDSFDRFTRRFAWVASRRALGGAVLGTLGGLLRLDTVSALPCPKGKKRCKQRCIPKKRCCTNANCRPRSSGKICVRGRCVCPVGRLLCQGNCLPRASLDTSPQHCGACGNACGVNERCCSGVCRDITLPERCGSCGSVCPGLDQPTAIAICADPSTGRCGLICRDENYDLDGIAANGCESRDSVAGNHTIASAIDLGSFDCVDSPRLFSGVIVSDDRDHQPEVPGFVRSTGSAPDWFRVRGTGGVGCTRGVRATIFTSGGGPGLCYRLTIQTDEGSAAVGVRGHNPTPGAQITLPLPYSENSSIYFRVDKICDAATVQERVNYTVTYVL